MSESQLPHASSPQSREPLDRPESSMSFEEAPKTWPIGTVVSVPIGLLLFAGIVQLMFMIAAPTSVVDSSKLTPQQKIRELQAGDQKRLTSYGWIDPKAKITHIPIERAMELTVTDLAKDPNSATPPPPKEEK